MRLFWYVIKFGGLSQFPEVQCFNMLQVQNAVEFLKMIGALDENENLTHLGELSTPVSYFIDKKIWVVDWGWLLLGIGYSYYLITLSYLFIFLIREVFVCAPCGSQARENADNGCYFPLL